MVQGSMREPNRGDVWYSTITGNYYLLTEWVNLGNGLDAWWSIIVGTGEQSFIVLTGDYRFHA